MSIQNDSILGMLRALVIQGGKIIDEGVAG